MMSETDGENSKKSTRSHKFAAFYTFEIQVISKTLTDEFCSLKLFGCEMPLFN